MTKHEEGIQRKKIFKDAIKLISEKKVEDIKEYVNGLISDYIKAKIDIDDLDTKMTALVSAIEQSNKTDEIQEAGFFDIIEISSNAKYYTDKPNYDPNDPNSFQKKIESYYSEITIK